MDTEPTFIWTSASSGLFSTASTYRLINKHSSIDDPHSPPHHFWKSLWKFNLNDRLKLFLWKISWNILPTKERLSHLFSLSSDHLCSLCKVKIDSMHHLFSNYVFARVAWHHSFWPLDTTTFNFTSMVNWINIIISLGSSWVIPKGIITSFKSLPMWHVISYGSTGIKLFMMVFPLMLDVSQFTSIRLLLNISRLGFLNPHP